MKFLVITDLHQHEKAVEWINDIAEKNDVKAILFLGDVLSGDPLAPGTCDDARMILSKFKKKTYFIPGNCDYRDLPEKVSDIVTVVHGKAFEIDGIKFAALGGSNPTIFGTPFEMEEEEITKMLDPISSEGMILMTHAPSFGILDEIPSNINVGSTAIRDIVKKYKPIVALSGHIHEAVGIKNIDGTLFINPGPARDGRAVILETDGKTASAEPVGPGI